MMEIPTHRRPTAAGVGEKRFPTEGVWAVVDGDFDSHSSLSLLERQGYSYPYPLKASTSVEDLLLILLLLRLQLPSSSHHDCCLYGRSKHFGKCCNLC